MISRKEFECICDPWGMADFINTYDLDFDMPDTDDIYSADGFDEYVWDSIREWNDSWEDLGRWLRYLPEPGDDYYLYDCGDFEVYDFDQAMCDLEEYIEEVYGFEEDEDDEDEDDEDEDDDELVCEAGSFDSLWEGAA